MGGHQPLMHRAMGTASTAHAQGDGQHQPLIKLINRSSGIGKGDVVHEVVAAIRDTHHHTLHGRGEGELAAQPRCLPPSVREVQHVLHPHSAAPATSAAPRARFARALGHGGTRGGTWAPLTWAGTRAPLMHVHLQSARTSSASPGAPTMWKESGWTMTWQVEHAITPLHAHSIYSRSV